MNIRGAQAFARAKGNQKKEEKPHECTRMIKTKIDTITYVRHGGIELY